MTYLIVEVQGRRRYYLGDYRFYRITRAEAYSPESVGYHCERNLLTRRFIAGAQHFRSKRAAEALIARMKTRVKDKSVSWEIEEAK